MQNFIKDTDFLPNVVDISNDVYKLLYGIPKLFVETRIYDAITMLCRRYPDTPLRRAKLNGWKTAIKETLNSLERLNRGEGRRVYIPYFERLCSADSLINLYRFAEGVLLEMERLPHIPDYRTGTSKEAILQYFPFGDFENVLREFGNKCVKTGKYPESVVAAIEKELENRGMVASSTLQVEKTFEEFFYGSESCPEVVVQKQGEEKEEKSSQKGEWKTKTGFIYYALQKYFKDVYDNRYGKNESLKKLVRTASFRIASGLFKPEVPIAGEERVLTTNNTFYQYIDKTFDNPKSRDTKSKAAAQKLFKDFIK